MPRSFTKKLIVFTLAVFLAFLTACTEVASTNQTTTTSTTITSSEPTGTTTTEVTTMPTTTTVTTPTTTTEDPALAYLPFYQHDDTTPYPEDLSGSLFKASMGYQGMLEQGYNNWYYEATSAFTELVPDPANDRFGTDSANIRNAILYTDGADLVSLTFKAPRSGTLIVTGNVTALTGSTFYVALNGVKVYPESEDQLILSPDVIQGYYLEFSLEVCATDRIEFVLSSGLAKVQPVLMYDELIESSLYFDYNNEYFPNTYPRHIGDVHPFYYEGKLYMYYLETNGRYTVALLESPNMLLYSEKQLNRISPYPSIDTYYVLGIAKYQDKFVSYYGASAVAINSSVSTDLYNWSAHNTGEVPAIDNATGRDPYVFYDPDIDRYRIIYISYYSRDTSADGDFDAALWLLTSEDASPEAWASGHKEMLRLDNAGASGREDPEVPQMAKIGDRWYLITSIYSRSVHGVGRLSYFKGEANTLIDDEDWTTKTEQFIDGEDICAAQLVQIGDKWYMFGWIPNNTISSYWGGALSIAREVYQLPNGDLATRFDPYMTKLLNQGLIYDIAQGGLTTVQGEMLQAEDNVTLIGSDPRYDFPDLAEARVPENYKRVIVDFTLSIPDPDGKAGIILKNEEYATRHFVYIDRAASMLYVYSRTVEGNLVKASLRIDLDSYDDIKVEVLVDGSIVDVFVNGTYSLAARVTTKGYQELTNTAISLFASGEADFTGFAISKLASQENVFD